METFFPDEQRLSSKLEQLAKDNPDQKIDIDKLDEPMLGPTQENRSQLPEVSRDTKDYFEEQDWPKDITDEIDSEAEANIYTDANIEPSVVNGKDVLARTDVDLEKKDDFGRTNLERMEKGLSPLDSDGKPYELHHIGQKSDSPLAELSRDEHRGKGNDNILHDKLKESEINREDFAKERQEHWKARAEQYKS